jgi:hypothetical protein
VSFFLAGSHLNSFLCLGNSSSSEPWWRTQLLLIIKHNVKYNRNLLSWPSLQVEPTHATLEPQTLGGCSLWQQWQESHGGGGAHMASQDQPSCVRMESFPDSATLPVSSPKATDGLSRTFVYKRKGCSSRQEQDWHHLMLLPLSLKRAPQLSVLLFIDPFSV